MTSKCKDAAKINKFHIGFAYVQLEYSLYKSPIVQIGKMQLQTLQLYENIVQLLLQKGFYKGKMLHDSKIVCDFPYSLFSKPQLSSSACTLKNNMEI